MDLHPCGSSLPWILAIEALSCSSLVEPSLLQELLEKAPPTSIDIGNARELLALRHLEGLYVQGARANHVSSASGEKVGFDLSENCEDVLRRVLREISPSEQNPRVPDLSKWDLESFIEHKKSKLRKCTLKQLKDGIVSGSLPISATLKEKSGLPVGIHVENEAPAKDGNCSTSIAGGRDKDDGDLMPSELPDENSAPGNRKRKAGETPAERLCKTCIDPAQKNKCDIICNEHDVGSESGRKGLCELIRTNEDIDKIEQNVTKPVEIVGEAEDVVDISSDDDGCHDERTIIDIKKKTFLSSQSTYNQDELATTCMKCNKGGNLLSCNSDSCPIVFHESCLGPDNGIDSKDKFCCPFCAYSRALTKCKEVKKYASLIRKDLRTFICLGLPNESKKQSCGSSMIDGNCLRKNDALPTKTNELNQINVVEKVSNHHHGKKLEVEQAGPSELHSDHSPPFGRKAAGSTDKIVQSLERDKQDANGIRQESQAPFGPKQNPIAAESVHNTQIETKSCEVSETRSEKHADFRSNKGVTHPSGTGSQSSQFTDAEEISEQEDDDEDSGVSKYFISVRIQERQNLHPEKPESRKKRLPWTSKEEDVLKKGVQKFSVPHSNIIPWKKILIFGEGEFNPSRTAMDLKGKWRNICKAPKST